MTGYPVSVIRAYQRHRFSRRVGGYFVRGALLLIAAAAESFALDIPGVYGTQLGIVIATYGSDVQLGLAILGGIFLAAALWRIHLARAWWMTRRLGRRFHGDSL
jgi:hypothetical protein